LLDGLLLGLVGLVKRRWPFLRELRGQVVMARDIKVGHDGWLICWSGVETGRIEMGGCFGVRVRGGGERPLLEAPCMSLQTNRSAEAGIADLRVW
jgi:hypothetical protein